MAYENLLYEKKDKIGYITFNRPKVLNALNRKTMEELGHLLSQAREDAEVLGNGVADGKKKKKHKDDNQDIQAKHETCRKS